jgi:hypothetical protein
MAEIKIGNPDGLARPMGQYSHIARVKASELLFIAGQLAADKDGKLVGADDFDAQCGRVHDLPGAFAGRAEIHEVQAARISAYLSKRRLSA